MQKNITLAAVFLLAISGTAAAGGKEGSFGVGTEVALNGDTGGLSMNYDAGKFHFGGFIGFRDGGGDDDTDYTFGARFYYHVHESSMSDFGVGGGLSFYSADDTNTMIDNRQSRLYFEPGLQIRAFLSNNVALSFTAGFSFGVADANGVKIGGQSAGATDLGAQLLFLGGVHYYFFK
jgi:hypothetical protein